jgi:hypothetical protein
MGVLVSGSAGDGAARPGVALFTVWYPFSCRTHPSANALMAPSSPVRASKYEAASQGCLYQGRAGGCAPIAAGVAAAIAHAVNRTFLIELSPY